MVSHAQGGSAPESVGVDVSKASLVVAERGGGEIRRRTVTNTAEAAAAFADELVRRGLGGPIVVEATGAYHWPMVLAAAERGLDVRLINPLQAAKHRQGRVRKCKTDPVDAAVLADMGVTERELPPSFRRDRTAVQLRQHLSLLESLEATIQSLAGTLRGHEEAAAFAGVAPAVTAADLAAQLDALRARRRALQAEAHALAKRLSERERRRRWSALPGVSEELGAVLESVLSPDAGSAKSWVAFLGLDVSVRQSGKSVGKGRLSKRGSPYLRKRLFQAAWGAAMNDGSARAYYDRLKEEGRAHQEALVIIARKLLRAGFALLRDPDREVDPERLFALPA